MLHAGAWFIKETGSKKMSYSQDEISYQSFGCGA